MKLPKGLEERFRQQLVELEATKAMPYITSIERMGIEQGRKEGLEQGLEQGREQGRLLALRENILDLLESRFGAVPYSLRERVTAESDLMLLKAWLRLAATCGRIEDFKI